MSRRRDNLLSLTAKPQAPQKEKISLQLPEAQTVKTKVPQSTLEKFSMNLEVSPLNSWSYFLFAQQYFNQCYRINPPTRLYQFFFIHRSNRSKYFQELILNKESVRNLSIQTKSTWYYFSSGIRYLIRAVLPKNKAGNPKAIPYDK